MYHVDLLGMDRVRLYKVNPFTGRVYCECFEGVIDACLVLMNAGQYEHAMKLVWAQWHNKIPTLDVR